MTMADYANVSEANSLLSNAQARAQAAYQQGMLQYQNDQLAYQMAQSAFTDAMNMGAQYGFAPGGNWNSMSSVASNAPPAGTPTLAAGQAMGSIGYIPGYTGVNAGQTMGQLSQAEQLAQGAAGMTGFYAAPRQSGFTPGTFVRLDPSTYDTSRFGDVQISYVTPSGQLQRVSQPQARAMGWNGDLSTMNTLPASLAQQLEQAPPTSAPQQTLAGLQGYSNLNTAAINQALQASQATGMYTAPAAVTPPGTDLQGNKFSDLDQATQQAYFRSNGGDWNAAMTAWTNASNANIRQWAQANNIAVPGGAGTPQETLAAQQQYFTQAQNLAQMYGNYYAPGAPGQTAQAGTNMPTPGQQTLQAQQQYWQQGYNQQQLALQQWQAQQQAGQNYLQMMAGLRGPADWIQYQKVLGAAPQGLQQLAAAAAGQYMPGRGATSGVQPQAVSMPSFVNSATGGASGALQQQNAAGQVQGGYNPPASGNQTGYNWANWQQPGGWPSYQYPKGGYATDQSGQPGAPAAYSQTANQSDTQAFQNALVAPNQMAPQTWNALTPSQQQMLLGTWESQGYTQQDAQALFNQSLPKYGASSATAGGFKLV